MKGIQSATSTSTRAHRSFYCRWKNRVVHSCSRDGGPNACPLRMECPADTLLEVLPPSPTILTS